MIFLTLICLRLPYAQRIFDHRERDMSGERRLSREGNREPRIRTSDLNFGLIAMVLLTAIAIIVTLKFPEIQLKYLAGP